MSVCNSVNDKAQPRVLHELDFKCHVAPHQEDNNGLLFHEKRICERDLKVLQEGPVNTKELMHGLRLNFWCQVRVQHVSERSL